MSSSSGNRDIAFELTASLLARAIQRYLSLAYPDGRLPDNRSQFSSFTPEMPLEEMLSASGVVESPPVEGHGIHGYSLRVGNAWFPHMKVIIQPYARPPGFVFSVETHDHFKLADNHPEQEAMRALKARNQALAREVERAWESDGLPTQNGLLRQYLRESRESRKTQ